MFIASVPMRDGMNGIVSRPWSMKVLSNLSPNASSHLTSADGCFVSSYSQMVSHWVKSTSRAKS
jgi:hypothetical protein